MKQTVNWEWSNPFFWTTAIGGKEVDTSLWGGTFSLKKQSLMMNPPFQWARQAAKKHHTAFRNTFLTHLQPNAWVMRYFSCHSCQCFSALVCCGIPPVYPTEIIRPHGLEPENLSSSMPWDKHTSPSLSFIILRLLSSFLALSRIVSI